MLKQPRFTWSKYSELIVSLFDIYPKVMRIYFLLIFITGFILKTQAQIDTLVYTFGDSTAIDVQPEFPGGEAAFLKFIQLHVIYPEDAKLLAMQGVVRISFIIEKDGSLSTFNPLAGKYFSTSCESEVIRVLRTSPRWKPGSKNGIPIRTKKIAIVKFSLGGPTGIAIRSDGKHLKASDKVNDSTLFINAETFPVFNGEGISLYKYIKDNTIYPADAKEQKITESVIVSFVVEKDGSVSNIYVVREMGLYPSCDKAAIELVSNFPKWVPGEYRGKPVRVQQMVRVSFE